MDVVKHMDIPDRDLYVYDVKTDKLVKTVRSLGTLLFGLDVDSSGNTFIRTPMPEIIQMAGRGPRTRIEELQNRPYLNRIAKVSPQGKVDFIPPQSPSRATQTLRRSRHSLCG